MTPQQEQAWVGGGMTLIGMFVGFLFGPVGYAVGAGGATFVGASRAISRLPKPVADGYVSGCVFILILAAVFPLGVFLDTTTDPEVRTLATVLKWTLSGPVAGAIGLLLARHQYEPDTTRGPSVGWMSTPEVLKLSALGTALGIAFLAFSWYMSTSVRWVPGMSGPLQGQLEATAPIAQTTLPRYEGPKENRRRVDTGEVLVTCDVKNVSQRKLDHLHWKVGYKDEWGSSEGFLTGPVSPETLLPGQTGHVVASWKGNPWSVRVGVVQQPAR